MTSMFPSSEFDRWAEDYDISVRANDSFPFLGYEVLIDTIVKLAEPREGLSVLDLSTGTGNLADLFAHAGCEVWCADFSEAMLKKAKQKVPEAHFVVYDMHDSLPPELARSYDHIVSAFTFHHFDLNEKVEIIQRLLPYIACGGSITIGDISFPDAAAREKAKADLGNDWDEEFYWLAANDIPALEVLGMEINYQQTTPFSGIFHLRSLAIS